jgi:ribonuclease BN (tRNA processing enzyme)
MQSWQGKELHVDILHSRAGVAQQILISHKTGVVLFDAGDGTIRDLLENKIPPKHIKGIALTHGHFDHMGGLFTLLGFMRMIGRKEPLPIHFPPGSIEIQAILGAFQVCYSTTTPFAITARETPPGTTFEIAGMQITAFEMIHCGGTAAGGILDRIPALGYRISCHGETIAISGDTGDCPALRKMVAGVDLAILEATHRTNAEAGAETLQKVHLSAELAAEIGRTAKEFILVHKSGER